jgi:hypothetical protein
LSSEFADYNIFIENLLMAHPFSFFHVIQVVNRWSREQIYRLPVLKRKFRFKAKSFSLKKSEK